MESNTLSNQCLPISSFNRDVKPLFPRIEPDTIETVKQASLPFSSLVDFIKKGNILNSKGTEQACGLLQRIVSVCSVKQILFVLIPTPDHSCSGFTQSIVPLLTSSNEELVKASLSLLQTVAINFSVPTTCFDILATGLLTLLPQSFYKQEIHLFAQHRMYLMRIVISFMSCVSPSSTRVIFQNRQVSADSFKPIFIDNFLHPIQPFLEFISRNRRRITDSGDSHHFSQLLGSLIEYAPFLEEMTQFVLSSSLLMTWTDSLHFIETDVLTSDLLWFLKDGFLTWKMNAPAVQQRGQQILSKLRAEGLSDEIELHVRCTRFDFSEMWYVFLGAQLIHYLDANAPYLEEREG
ncbi:hypothetical protein BLNAU_14451 [Blattamonas nauphoetae]|uniref:Uncharacterized protein n=1 Tax=Blattamonas nauphoetae TaxID=2049346 RepID=A0ABQ9XGU2_9EUKA|nr:hypothetical protein BLNAU_14451 [Blattamonas nauphoetae]